MIRALVLVLLLVPIGSYASKDRGVYLGGGFSLVNVGVNDPFSNEVNFKAGEVILGYKYNAYLGLEVRGGASLQDETIAVDEENGLRDSVQASIDEYTSIYYRAELSNEIAKLYLLLGQSSVTTSLQFEENALGLIRFDESGLSYGAGFGMWLDERMNLNFEIKTLVTTDTDTFISGSIGADYRF